MLNVTHIDLATEEDKQYRLDHWASLFKAVTWEELKMLAKKDNLINEASNTIYQISRDERIRQQCEAREDYYRRQKTVKNIMKRQKEQLVQLTSEKASLENEKASLENEKASLENENASLKNEKSSLEKQLSEALKTIETLSATVC